MPEINFRKQRIESLKKTSPYIYIGMKSENRGEVGYAYIVLVFAVINADGSITIREVATSVTESVANTFTQTSKALTDYFGPEELERGVYPLGVHIMIGQLKTASGASTYMNTRVQVTKSTQSAMITIQDTDLLGTKILEGASGAAAGAVAHQVAYCFPSGDY
jgi:hypothetical protein